MSCQPGLPGVGLGPDLLHGERRHQLAVALDVGRRPEGRRPGSAGVGPGRLPPAAAAGPGGAVAAAAALVAVGLGQLGQVDARP